MGKDIGGDLLKLQNGHNNSLEIMALKPANQIPRKSVLGKLFMQMSFRHNLVLSESESGMLESNMYDSNTMLGEDSDSSEEESSSEKRENYHRKCLRSRPSGKYIQD